MMHNAPVKQPLRFALAAALGLALAGCGGMATNSTIYSLNQPVVERQNFTLDVSTSPSGLTIAEQSRLNGWFEAMDLRYGDRISVDDPSANPAVADAVNELAGRYGLIISETAPTTQGFVQPGEARIVLTRSAANVPDCPNWSKKSDSNYFNATSPGYGCAVNGNLAAMVANPEDLLEGQDGGNDRLIVPSNSGGSGSETGGGN